MSQVSTVVITPSDDDGYLNIIAEIDSRNAGYNAGKANLSGAMTFIYCSIMALKMSL